MLIPLGFLASSSGGVDSDFELIESYVLGSSQAAITFSSLGSYSSTYKHLQVRATARMTTGSVFGLRTQLNADTGTNYVHHLLYGNGTSVLSSVSSGNTYALTGLSAASSSPSNVFSSTVIDLLDAYSNTKNKTFRTMAGVVSTGIHIHSGLWINTASVTSWKLFPESGDWATGSRFSLYGIKG